MTTATICPHRPSAHVPPFPGWWEYPSAVVLHGTGPRPARHHTVALVDRPPRSPRPLPLPEAVFRTFFTVLLAGTVLALVALALGNPAAAWQSVRVWVSVGAMGIVPSAAWISRHETRRPPVPEGGA